jgi:hypothetical protein
MFSLARFIPAWAKLASVSRELVDGPIVQTILVRRVCDRWGGNLIDALSVGYA